MDVDVGRAFEGDGLGRCVAVTFLRGVVVTAGLAGLFADGGLAGLTAGGGVLTAGGVVLPSEFAKEKSKFYFQESHQLVTGQK